MKNNAFVYKEILSDNLTPILCFAAIGGNGSCILESAGQEGEHEQSLIGIHPIATFQATGTLIEITSEDTKRSFQGDPYKALEEFAQGRKAFGFISYHAASLKEKLPDRHPSTGIPDFFFHLYQTVIVFDHDQKKILFSHEGTEEELETILSKCYSPSYTLRSKSFENTNPIDFESNLDREAFAAKVRLAQEHIRAGDIFQVVLSRTFETDVKAPPFEIYRSIRQISPAPYLFFFQEEAFSILGASPELLISVKEGTIESMPIAGTCSKEQDPQKLLQDPKECAEHIMLVDLARNDVGAVAQTGSVCVSEYQKVHTFSHVHHIVSKVQGKLHKHLSPLDALKCSLPAGTLSGAPKIRAMEIIDDLETQQRGLYGGAIVSINEQGDLKSCIAIRMAVIQKGRATVQAGAGIVFDSDPDQEALETEAKARGILEAIQCAEGGLI